MKKYRAGIEKSGLSLYSVFLITAVILAATLNAKAQESTSSAQAQGTSETKIDDVKPEEAPKKFGATGVVEGSTNFRNNEDYESSRVASYTLLPSYQLTSQIKLGADVGFIHNLKQPEDSDFKNSTVSASYKAIPIIKDQLSITPTMSLVVATNRDTIDSTSLIGGIGLGQSLTYQLKQFGLPASVAYGASVRRNIHEFDHTSSGNANTEYSFSNSLRLDVEVTEKISFTTKASALSGLTYNDSWRSRFEIFEEVSYQVNDMIFLALGHVNTDATLKSDMASSNVEFFNNNTSSIYFDFGVTY